MKKFFATLLTIVVSCSFAGNIVYDYKASIKRIEPVYSVKKMSDKKNYVTDAFKTTSDTIVGYIVLPACATCVEDKDADTIYTEYTDDAQNGWEAKTVNQYSNYGYFIRKGDKLSKKLGGGAKGYPYIAKVRTNAEAGMFGAYTPMLSNNYKGAILPYANVKANKYAWMSVDFEIPANNVTVDSGNALKKYPGDKIQYGFLGFDNNGSVTVDNAGFGTVKVLSYSEAATLGFCSSTPGKNWSCQMVDSISGSTVGDTEYQGPCGVTPMWDVCYNASVVESEENLDPANETPIDYVIHDATIHGTWTLKYNRTLSAVSDAQKEGKILEKLGGKAIDMFTVKASSATSGSDN